MSCRSALNLWFTAEGALAAGVCINTYHRHKCVEVSLEPPGFCCLLLTHFNLATTILELTAFHASPASLQATEAFSSSKIPTPSFLVALSPSTGWALPECRQVNPLVTGQASFPNHLVSYIQATDTPYLFSFPTKRSYFLSTSSNWLHLSASCCHFLHTCRSPELST